MKYVCMCIHVLSWFLKLLSKSSQLAIFLIKYKLLFFRKKILLGKAQLWEQLESLLHFISTGFLRSLTIMFLWPPEGVRRDIILSLMNRFHRNHSVLSAIAHLVDLICLVPVMWETYTKILIFLVLNAARVVSFRYFLKIPYRQRTSICFFLSH